MMFVTIKKTLQNVQLMTHTNLRRSDTSNVLKLTSAASFNRNMSPTFSVKTAQVKKNKQKKTLIACVVYFPDNVV